LISHSASTSRLLQMKGITKRFTGVVALDDVDMSLGRGEILILVGENGAGKSTLMKILAGVYQKDNGSIEIDGREVELFNPHDAKDSGISIVFQEQALIPDLDAIENIFIGRELVNGFGDNLMGVLNRRQMESKAAEYLNAFNIHIDLSVPVRELGMGQRQVIEIIRGLIQDASLLILDEPTAALEDYEREQLFEFLRQLRKSGVGIIFCSHHLKECLEIGDRVMVLRDGLKVGDMGIADATIERIIELMIGKSLTDQYPKRGISIGRHPLLGVSDLAHKKAFSGVNFSLYPGEILGIAGLSGSGKIELARALFGAEKSTAGSIAVEGNVLPAKLTPHLAVKAGIAFLPADRKSEGLFLEHDLRYNICISNLKALISGWIRKDRENQTADRFVDALRIKTPSIGQTAGNLSGGNQQKVMIARWLFNDPKILIFEDPTRGIDVNAKVEVYKLMGDFAERGGAIIIVSSELPELEGICDRVLVMRHGKIAAEIDRQSITQETIALCCISSSKEGVYEV